MSTPDTMPEMEDRLRAALTARAEQVQPEYLAPLATVTPLQPRWRSPWVLLATAAAVLLVLGLVFQGLDRRPTSDDVAPRPDEPGIVFPPDIGRDWKADDLSTPARLDLDGDGVDEKVEFLAEPSSDYAGYTRLQTELTGSGDEAYGLAQLGTTIGTTAEEPVDADGDGDQELVLYREDLAGGPGAPVTPLVFDLRDGLLVEAPPVEQDLLLEGDVAVPGSATTYYDLVHIHAYWIEEGRLFSSRSVNAFARGNMLLLRPETYLADTYEWTLGEEGLLRPVDAGCVAFSPEALNDCSPGQADDPPVIVPVAAETFGTGEQVRFDDGYVFTARIDPAAGGSLVVEGSDGRTLRRDLEVSDARISTVQPMLAADGASLLVTSSSDPAYLQVLAQDADGLRALQPVGEVPLANAEPVRTWLTANGALVTLVENGDGTWDTWQWESVRPGRIAALPTGTVCFDDPDDPTTVRTC
ncbi:hypothetical protein AAII07_05520 [Microvirga sp. 0TCS3.31]